MENTIMIGRAARLNGDSDGTYRSIISTDLRGFGKKHGRDRWVNYAETILLRAMTELTSGNLSLKAASKRALGLYGYIAAVAKGELGDDNIDVFAVDAWGRVGGEMKRAGFVCEGRDRLNECIQALTEKKWPNFRVINLTNLVAETNVGWVLETQGVEAGARNILSKIAPDDHELQTQTLAVIDEMTRRLKGKRRDDVPANDDWQKWETGRKAA
jgi:hypothetical protein